MAGLGIKPFKDLTLCDDFMFSEVMRQPENVTPFLEELLQKRIARVVAIDKQKDMKDGYWSHGIRLDVYLEDEYNTKYDVEVQTTLRSQLEKRVRYYQSGIDRHTLEAGEDYEELCDSYVIFICINDYYKAGLAVYERESRIKDAPEIAYEDGSHVFILNTNFSRGNASAEILEFLRYIRAGYEGRSFDVSGSDYLVKIEGAINKIKMTEEQGRLYMTYATRMLDERKEGIKEGLKEGREEGRNEEKLATIREMLDIGMPVETISRVVRLSADKVRELIAALDKNEGPAQKNKK